MLRDYPRVLLRNDTLESRQAYVETFAEDAEKAAKPRGFFIGRGARAFKRVQKVVARIKGKQ